MRVGGGSGPLARCNIGLVVTTLASLINSPLSTVIFGTCFPRNCLVRGLRIADSKVSVSLLIFTTLAYAANVFLVFLRLGSFEGQTQGATEILVANLPNATDYFPSRVLPASRGLSTQRPIRLDISRSRSLGRAGRIGVCGTRLAASLFGEFVLRRGYRGICVNNLTEVPFLITCKTFLESIDTGMVCFSGFRHNNS